MCQVWVDQSTQIQSSFSADTYIIKGISSSQCLEMTESNKHTQSVIKPTSEDLSIHSCSEKPQLKVEVKADRHQRDG